MKRTRLLTFGLTAATTIMGLAATAFATGNVPRSPTLSRSQPIWVGYLIMAVMLIGTMAISLVPSKRGHQD